MTSFSSRFAMPPTVVPPVLNGWVTIDGMHPGVPYDVQLDNGVINTSTLTPGRSREQHFVSASPPITEAWAYVQGAVNQSSVVVEDTGE